ncbi:serine/threonine-protein phosphatase [Microbacteriaceae bacterium VKM Ac-2855]|nr:serine/threonine-protein phosphatase [Microbacteriaceae bacterium VKM Ac-2855]
MTQIGRSRSSFTVPVPGGGTPGSANQTIVTLGWAGRTDTGRVRAANEDSYLARSPIFAVADGMGGHAAGGFASSTVVTRLAEAVGSAIVTPEDIDRSLRAAVADIERGIEGSDRSTGTTVTGAALTVLGGEAYWAVFNIGDSRVYLYAAGRLTQLTIDHSVVQELVDAGMISRDEAESHPHSNVITRAVGFNDVPVPDYRLIPVLAQSRLLICSDGLTKEVTDTTIAGILADGESAESAASALLAAALDHGGRDNVTAIVVDVLSIVGADVVASI